MAELAVGMRYIIPPGIMVEVRPSPIAEAVYMLIGRAGWGRWYVTPSGQIVTTAAGSIKGATGYTTGDLRLAEGTIETR